MRRRGTEERILLETFQSLTAAERGGPPVADRQHVIERLLADADLRGRFEEILARYLMQVGSDQAALQHEFEKAVAMVDELLEPPWIPATYLGCVETSTGPHALVALGRDRRVVSYGECVSAESLRPGDEVYLTHDRQAVMERAATGSRRTGEVAAVVGWASDGMLVIRSRDEETVVTPGGRLEGERLAEGDRVLWDPDTAIALERVPQLHRHRFLLEDVPDLPLDAVGGLDREVARLLGALTTSLVAPDLARLYRLSGRLAVLLEGPSGVGKTLVTRVVAAEVQRISGRRCRIAVVPPAAWESAYVGETEANIRELFATLREEATDGLAILLLDEVDAIGRARGRHNNVHGDRFLTALLHELDGFAARGNVAIVAATNRKELLDPALVERLSDVEIRFPRPTRTAARRIAEIHLPPDVPCADERGALIDRIVTRLYARNGSAVTLLRMREGTERIVHAHELMSGRTLEQVCRDVRLAACGRHTGGDAAGVRVGDVEQAVADALRRLSTVLGPGNAHLHLPDLPMDVDVVAAEPLVGRVVRPADYRPAA